MFELQIINSIKYLRRKHYCRTQNHQIANQSFIFESLILVLIFTWVYYDVINDGACDTQCAETQSYEMIPAVFDFQENYWEYEGRGDREDLQQHYWRNRCELIGFHN